MYHLYLTMFLHVFSWILMLIGLFFCSMGVIGLFKLPDLLSKQHAVGLIDTLGVLCISFALALQSGFTLISLKAILLGVLAVFLSAPTCNLLVKAAIICKIIPAKFLKGTVSDFNDNYFKQNNNDD